MSIQPYPQQGVAVTCRSFEEYVRMFNLDEAALESGPILDIAAGASSFTAEANRRGFPANAADPQYAQDPDELIGTAEREIETSTRKLEAVKHQYDWKYYGDLVRHRAGRERSLKLFGDHYRTEKSGKTGIYIAGSFPNLPVPDSAYSLVLCSHFLFLYREQFDVEFHERALAEMLRVCKPGGQIRIYPLFTLHYVLYPELDTILETLRKQGAEVAYLTSKLPFIPGSEHVLCIANPNVSNK